ncbi:MAG TPA: HAD hydrolase family protein [Acidobacteriaceae bacterium]|nr:HAD hydrolase family protein [Acidobacteriaceae bacterium]
MVGRNQTPPRLIAVDMDGTLLGETGQVSPRNLAALLAAHAAGIEVVVATGRRHAYAMRVLRPLELPHACALISSNGAVTRTLGAPPKPRLDGMENPPGAPSVRALCGRVGEAVPTELIARTHMSLETALWLCGHLGELRDALVLTFDTVGEDGEDTRGALVVEHLNTLHSSIARWMEANEPYLLEITPIEQALQSTHGGVAGAPIQAMLCGTPERMRAAEAHLLLDPRVVAVGHTPDSVEPHHDIALHRTEYPARDLSILDILPAGCSKGAALLAFAASRGIDASGILAIGDNWNDVSMLEVAGSAVLMDNAPDDLKQLARQRGWPIGASHRDDGVAVAIESALGITKEVLSF